MEENNVLPNYSPDPESLSVSVTAGRTDVESWFSTGNNGPQIWIVS